MRNKSIVVSPFATNILDLIDVEDIITENNETVSIKHGMVNFEISINGAVVYQGNNNLDASYILNTYNIRFK